MTRYANMRELRRAISSDVVIVEEAEEQYAAAQVAAMLNAGAIGGALAVATPTEHDEQVALFAWAEANVGAHPELGCMFAVPNGGYRPMATAARLREEGVKAGVPDVFLPVMRRGVDGRGTDGRAWGGLFIEMKRKPNKLSHEQADWIARLRAAGYMAAVCYGADEAIDVIVKYLGMEG